MGAHCAVCFMALYYESLVLRCLKEIAKTLKMKLICCPFSSLDISIAENSKIFGPKLKNSFYCLFRIDISATRRCH